MWIIRLQAALIHWQEIFAQQKYNYDHIMEYAGMLATVDNLAKSLNIGDQIYGVEDIEKFRTNYYESYTKLSSLIVKKAIDIDGYVHDSAYTYTCMFNS